MHTCIYIYVVCNFLFSGEKIDMKNVETLEEIFKLVQFQCVDLEGTHLDEEVLFFTHLIL